MSQISVLDNGLRIVTDFIPHVETVSLGAWIQVGARFENKEISGISHVLEHMAFKGTTTRSALQISEAIESVGGYLNAYTSRESTAYYARILKEDVTIAMDILSDILQNSTFQEAELSREKEVIIQEIGMTNDTPDDIVFDYFQETCFKDQNIGRSILGTPENVRGFTPDQVRTYMHDHYNTHNMVFAAAGNVDHDTVVLKLKDLFADFPVNTLEKPHQAIYTGGEYVLDKDLEQVHILLGFEGVQIGHANAQAQMILSTILGGGMSSRLFQEVREKRGLVYGINAFASSFSDSGVFTIYAATGPEKAGELLPVVIDELKKATENLTDDEIKRAKTQLKASLLMGLESTSSRCERVANQMLFHGRTIATPEVVEKIDRVTKSDLENYLVGLLTTPPTLTAYGQTQTVTSYTDVVEMLK
jgi:predicted Zn-dependent peptidase